MRQAILLALVVLWGCSDPVANTTSAPVGGHSPQAQQAPATPFPIQVSGTSFTTRAGKPFTWRGITAFRLAEMIAGGREAEVVQYLDWAASQDVTVVRVLLMAQNLFKLSPEAGRTALPRLLDLAKERGVAVEAVALADTRGVDFDFESHVGQVARVAQKHGNAFVEIANEPGHPTQDPRLHDPAFVARLATVVPDGVLVALGSTEYDDRYADGDYATHHFPRENEWGHVLGLAKGAGMVQRWQKPVVNDEPIGAMSEYQAGRRDNVPERFGAAAALTRLAGMSGTFHYEGGLQARLPDPNEQASLTAWMAGLALVPDSAARGQFLQGDEVAALAQVEGARAVFVRRQDTSAAILLIDPSASPSIKLAAGWKEQGRSSAPGVLLVTAQRRQTH